MSSDEQLTLFDLIGREWASDEAQAIVSYDDGLKAVRLDTCDIYDFRRDGVKIFTDKAGGGNEISEILIREAPGSVDRRLARLPCDLRIGQPQEQARTLLGKPYDSHLGHTYPVRKIPGVICALPPSEVGWDKYHSSQLAARLKIHLTKPFLLTIGYSLWRGGFKQIRNAEEKTLLLVPESQCVGEMVLKTWDGALPKRHGLRSVGEILDRDARRTPVIDGLFKRRRDE